MTHEPARMGRRVTARLVDFALTLVAYASMALGGYGALRAGATSVMVAWLILVPLVMAVLTLYSLVAKGGLLGHWVLGLRHVNPATGRTSAGGTFVKYLLEGLVCSVTLGLGYLLVVATARPPGNRSWFDRVAGVQLVDLRRPLSAPREPLLSPTPPELGAGTAFGNYRIVRLLGRGGMGEVYVAEQASLSRQVALKVIRPEVSGEEHFRTRFAREAAALARLDSAHVVSIHDFGEVDGRLYLATQLVPGGDLADTIRAHGAMPKEAAVRVMSHIAEGLSAAHRAGLLHRDVKPSNVLLRQTPRGLHAYLCDFGIAAELEGSSTQTVGVAGSLAYLAPERLRGAPATVASDVYALGCVLWECLTGMRPGAGGTLPRIDHTTPDLHALALAAMSPDPALRPPSADEFGQRLRRLAEGTPVVAVAADGDRPLTPRTTAQDADVPSRSGVRPRGGRLALAGGLLSVLLVGGLLVLAGTRLTGRAPDEQRGGDEAASPTLRGEGRRDDSRFGAALPATDATGDGLSDVTLVSRPYDGAATALVVDAASTPLGVHPVEVGQDDTFVRGDFDGDARTDLLVLQAAPGTPYHVVSFDGVVMSEGLLGVPHSREMALCAGDFDGDGDADVAQSRPGHSAAELVVWTSHDALLSSPVATAVDSSDPAVTRRVLCADFTGDGLEDVAQVVRTGSVGVDFRMWESHGDGFGDGSSWWSMPTWTFEHMKLLAGDFTGDGIADLAQLGQPPSGGVNLFVLASTGGGYAEPLEWMRNPLGDWHAMRLLAGDYDGDGLTDVASVEPAPGGVALRVRRSTGTELEDPRTAASLEGVPWSHTLTVGNRS